MPAGLYEAGPNGLWVFLLLTIALGGGAAFVSGKSIAETWRPLWQVPIYMVLLAFAVRFLHFSLFEEKLLSPVSFLVDYAFLFAVSICGYRIARNRQMRTQYVTLAK